MSYFASFGSILTKVGNIVLDEVDKALEDEEDKPRVLTNDPINHSKYDGSNDHENFTEINLDTTDDDMQQLDRTSSNNSYDENLKSAEKSMDSGIFSDIIINSTINHTIGAIVESTQKRLFSSPYKSFDEHDEVVVKEVDISPIPLDQENSGTFEKSMIQITGHLDRHLYPSSDNHTINYNNHNTLHHVAIDEEGDERVQKEHHNDDEDNEDHHADLTRLHDMEIMIEKLITDNSHLEHKIITKNKEIYHLTQENNQLKYELNTMKSSSNNNNTTILSSNPTSHTNLSTLMVTQEQHEQLHQELLQIQSQLQQYIDKELIHTQNINELQTQLDQSQQTQHNIQIQYDTVQNTHTQLISDYNQLRQSFHEKSDEFSRLQQVHEEDKIQILMDKHIEIETMKASYERQLDELHQTISTLSTMNPMNTVSTISMTSLKEKHDDDDDDDDDRKKEVTDCNTCAILKEENNQYLKRLYDYEIQVKQSIDEIQHKNSTIDTLELQVNSISQELESIQNKYNIEVSQIHVQSQQQLIEYQMKCDEYDKCIQLLQEEIQVYKEKLSNHISSINVSTAVEVLSQEQIVSQEYSEIYYTLLLNIERSLLTLLEQLPSYDIHAASRPIQPTSTSTTTPMSSMNEINTEIDKKDIEKTTLKIQSYLEKLTQELYQHLNQDYDMKLIIHYLYKLYHQFSMNSHTNSSPSSGSMHIDGINEANITNGNTENSLDKYNKSLKEVISAIQDYELKNICDRLGNSYLQTQLSVQHLKEIQSQCEVYKVQHVSDSEDIKRLTDALTELEIKLFNNQNIPPVQSEVLSESTANGTNTSSYHDIHVVTQLQVISKEYEDYQQITQIQIDSLNTQIQCLEKDQQQLVEQTIKSTLSQQYESTIKQVQNEHKIQLQTIQQEYENKIKILQNSLQDTSRNQETYDSQLKELRAQNIKLDTESKQLHQVITQLRQVRKTSKEDIDQICNEKDTYKNQIGVLQQDIDRLQSLLQQSIVEKDKLVQYEREIQSAKDYIQSLESSHTQIKQDYSNQEKRVYEFTQENQKLLLDNKLLLQENTNKDIECNNIKLALDSIEKQMKYEIQQYHNKIEKIKQEYEIQYKEQIQTINRQYEDKLLQYESQLEESENKVKDEVLLRKQLEYNMCQEKKKLQLSIEQAVTQLQNSTKDVVDKALISNLFINYFRKRSTDVLELIAKILSFTSEQKESIGLTSTPLSPPVAFISSVLNTVVGKPIATPENIEGENLAELWVNFLLNETDQQQVELASLNNPEIKISPRHAGNSTMGSSFVHEMTSVPLTAKDMEQMGIHLLRK